jgi:signal peptidase II
MTRISRVAVIVLVLSSCVGCDQITKSIVRAHLPEGKSILLLDGTVRLQHAENPGAFLSLGQSLAEPMRRVLFTVGGAFLVGIALLWTLSVQSTGVLQTIGAALISGGGLGNLIDRIVQGHVTDFLNVGVGGLRTGIFNCADVALMLGIVLVALVPKKATPAARR